jgi:hypothetical protein
VNATASTFATAGAAGHIEALRNALVPISPLVPRALPTTATASANMPGSGPTPTGAGMASAPVAGGMGASPLRPLLAGLPSGGLTDAGWHER